MTEQYKNPFEDPEEKLWDQKVKDYKIPERKEIPLEGRVAIIPGYIYVPSIKLYVAKEKSLHGLSWEDAHKELHKKGLQMLTIRQFIDFLLYLQKNKTSIKDAKQILDEILTKREPWRGEWLDARFTRKEGVLHINYNHQTVNGNPQPQNTEPLEECLMRYCYIDLKSCNKQGLPTKKGNECITEYDYPREYSVAGFGRGPYLNCDWYAGPEPLIGVRAARKLK